MREKMTLKTHTWGVILISLILHECAHGYVAYRCGDPTAKLLGRLSLNPAKHLDPVGTLCMFLLGFGWAKPVPVNPRNFRNYRRDDFLVSIAGVTVNLTIFIASVLLSCLINPLLWSEGLLDIMREEFGNVEVMVNPFYGWVLTFEGHELSLGASSIMNYGHELIASFGAYMENSWLIYVQRALLLLAQVNLTLAIFNLMPIPPLDGFHVLNDTILKGKLQLNRTAFQVTRVVLAVLLLSGALNTVLSTCVTTVYEAVLRFALALTGQM